MVVPRESKSSLDVGFRTNPGIGAPLFDIGAPRTRSLVQIGPSRRSGRRPRFDPWVTGKERFGSDIRPVTAPPSPWDTRSTPVRFGMGKGMSGPMSLYRWTEGPWMHGCVSRVGSVRVAGSDGTSSKCRTFIVRFDYVCGTSFTIWDRPQDGS